MAFDSTDDGAWPKAATESRNRKKTLVDKLAAILSRDANHEAGCSTFESRLINSAPFRRGSPPRAVAVLLLICALAFAQLAALPTGVDRHTSAQHCCSLCHAGPIASLQPVALWLLAPLLPTVWLTADQKLNASHAPLIISGESRAPPTL